MVVAHVQRRRAHRDRAGDGAVGELGRRPSPSRARASSSSSGRSSRRSIGAVAFVITTRMPYGAWRKAWGPLAGVTLVLLVLVFHSATGQSGGGSARWIAFGPVTLQPSELAKFVVVIASAAILLAERARWFATRCAWWPRCCWPWARWPS